MERNEDIAVMVKAREEDLARIAKCAQWNERSSRCPKAAEGFEPYHKWIVTSTVITPTSQTVTMIMCGICFHEVNLSEAFQHRDCFKS